MNLRNNKNCPEPATLFLLCLSELIKKNEFWKEEENEKSINISDF